MVIKINIHWPKMFYQCRILFYGSKYFFLMIQFPCQEFWRSNLSVLLYIFCKIQKKQSLGPLSIASRDFAGIFICFNSWFFYISFHSCPVKFSHLILLSDFSLLVKSVISSLECSPNNLLILQYFINISLIWL